MSNTLKSFVTGAVIGGAVLITHELTKPYPVDGPIIPRVIGTGRDPIGQVTLKLESIPGTRLYHAFYAKIFPGPDLLLGTPDDTWGPWERSNAAGTTILLPGTQEGSWQIAVQADTPDRPVKGPPISVRGKKVWIQP